jgi:hypothetical protein
MVLKLAGERRKVFDREKKNIAVRLWILNTGNEELFETTSLDHLCTPFPPIRGQISYFIKIPTDLLRPGCPDRSKCFVP